MELEYERLAASGSHDNEAVLVTCQKVQRFALGIVERPVADELLEKSGLHPVRRHGREGGAECAHVFDIELLDVFFTPGDQHVDAEAPTLLTAGDIGDLDMIGDPFVHDGSQDRGQSAVEVSDLLTIGCEKRYRVRVVLVVRLTEEAQRGAGSKSGHDLLPAFEGHSCEFGVEGVGVLYPYILLPRDDLVRLLEEVVHEVCGGTTLAPLVALHLTDAQLHASAPPPLVSRQFVSEVDCGVVLGHGLYLPATEGYGRHGRDPVVRGEAQVVGVATHTLAGVHEHPCADEERARVAMSERFEHLHLRD